MQYLTFEAAKIGHRSKVKVDNYKCLSWAFRWNVYMSYTINKHCIKDVRGNIPKSDLLGVTVARIHVAGQ